MRAPNPERLRASIRQRYAGVSCSAAGVFAYPTGRAGARALGYAPEWLTAVDEAALGSYCGVGNPLGLGVVEGCARLLDVGCGAGLDLRYAHWLMPTAALHGIDLTIEMIARARQSLAAAAISADLRVGTSELLPYADETFDLVISNGVLNLSTDKTATFAELLRVLRPGGRLQFADIVRVEFAAGEGCSPDEWSD
jgi:arsenite methyltransferase